MPYHHTPNTTQSTTQSATQSTAQSTTNAEGQVAPPGYHYMPDGTLMSDVEHAALYGTDKMITDLVFDQSDISANGEDRKFKVLGSNGATFRVEIKNEDSYYYNFQTNTFQSTKTDLKQTIIGNEYTFSVRFPKVSDADKYDIYLWAEENTEHSSYIKRMFNDGTIDLNKSKGSNSLLLQKELYQLLDVTLTISALSPNSLTNFSGITSVNQEITISGKPKGKIPFSITATSGTAKAFQVLNTSPNTSSNIGVYLTRTIGSAGVKIEDEDVFTTVRSANKVVDGRVSGSANVTMDDDVGSFWAVGDRVTGNAALDAKTGDNAVTVTAINVGSNAKVFTMSEAVTIDDDETLTFTKQTHYRWPIDNLVGITEGSHMTGTNVTAGTTVSTYNAIF